MNNFEQQVADALDKILTVEAQKAPDGKTPRDFFREQVAPRVAAAIDRAREAVAERFKEAVLAADAGRPLSDPAEERENVRRDALAALRGDVS